MKHELYKNNLKAVVQGHDERIVDSSQYFSLRETSLELHTQKVINKPLPNISDETDHAFNTLFLAIISVFDRIFMANRLRVLFRRTR